MPMWQTVCIIGVPNIKILNKIWILVATWQKKKKKEATLTLKK